MGPRILRIRGPLAADLDIAWLHRRDRWKCSADPTFDVVCVDGRRVHVTCDPETDWRSLANHYTGPWSGLEEHDAQSPFRPGHSTEEDAVEYVRVVLRRDASLEVWGKPSYAAVDGSYREAADGALEAMEAVRVRLEREDDIEPLSRFRIAVLPAAAGLVAGAIFTPLPMAVGRVALLVGVAILYRLHRKAAPFMATRLPSKPAKTRSRMRAMLNQALSELLPLFFIWPNDTWWMRLSINAVVAVAIASLAVKTLRNRHAKLVRALLSPSAEDAIVQGGYVLTSSQELAPENIAMVWTEEPGEPSSPALLTKHSGDFSEEGGDAALVVRVGEKWALVRTGTSSLRARLRRHQAWNRVMPWVYFAIATLTLATAALPN